MHRLMPPPASRNEAPGPFRIASLYVPHGSEMDPGPLGEALTAAGTWLCLPTVLTPGAPLAFQRWAAGEELAADALGMRAPTRRAPFVTPDLVVTPLLAFDALGGRLGQGGGYYDRTLAELRARGQVCVLGLAWAGQEVERLPAETHDQPLDAVLTERELRFFEREG
jgi:5-formyltetrahydrofolate cyclo-ligase